jgi:hypothetical protein
VETCTPRLLDGPVRLGTRGGGGDRAFALLGAERCQVLAGGHGGNAQTR